MLGTGALVGPKEELGFVTSWIIDKEERLAMMTGGDGVICSTSTCSTKKQRN